MPPRPYMWGTYCQSTGPAGASATMVCSRGGGILPVGDPGSDAEGAVGFDTGGGQEGDVAGVGEHGGQAVGMMGQPAFHGREHGRDEEQRGRGHAGGRLARGGAQFNGGGPPAGHPAGGSANVGLRWDTDFPGTGIGCAR
jgi:hypothetical protein